MTAPKTQGALERLTPGETYARLQAQAQAATFEVISKAGHDPAAVAAVVATLDNAALRVAVASLALMVDEELTLRQLKAKLAELYVAWPCHPALWGQSWTSKAEHGTRSRYNAGCRGDACRAADNAYRSARQKDAPPPDPGGRRPLALVAG